MIRHSVVFKLKHKAGSEEEKDFLRAVKKLAAIASVKNFACMKEISPKNDFDFGLTMDFTDQNAYDYYSQHQEHKVFVQNHWIPEVVDFMEIDYLIDT
ncbi:MAG: Dabb family protein [Lentisphaeria bacterium]|nr:Dabb family protein [Lentisphaeria bacterium]